MPKKQGRKHKILSHPDKKEILKKLNRGDSTRSVYRWIQKKYKDDKKNRLSLPTIQNFRKDYLNLDGKVLKDIKDEREKVRRGIEQQQIQAKLEKNSAYQEKINEIADSHLNVSRKILQLDKIIEDRMEYWFNAVYSGDSTPQAADKEMRQYMDRQMALLQQYKKFVEGVADHTVQHNVNITVMNEQIALLRDAIKEAMEEMAPETAMRFMDKLNNKVNLLEYSKEEIIVNKNTLNAIEAEILPDDEE